MDGIINLLFIGIALVATWGTWALALVIACLIFRFTFIGYISPEQYRQHRIDKAKKFVDLLEKIAKDSENNDD